MNIEILVERFLAWPVPADVYPDGTPGQPGRTGTNLLTHTQAKQMLEYVMGENDSQKKLLALLRDWQTFAKDVNAADCAGQEWLDSLKARTQEVLKP